MFTLAQVNSFVAVAEEPHFGRAAERLHMTQPPLSRQIMLLEREVGVGLLDRSSRVVTLTPAGRVFLTDARRILRLADEALLAAQRVPAGDGGTLVIGFTAVSVHGYVQSVLQRIGEELPHVDLVLRELVSAAQVEAIAAGDIDLGFLRAPRYVQYVSQVHTMLALVQAGVGVALVPESATAMHPDGVVFAELAGGQSPPVELAAAWRENAGNPVLSRALALVSAASPASGTPGRKVSVRPFKIRILFLIV